MNKQRLGILIVAVVGMLATFMPWVNVPIIGSVDGTKGDGWITFVLFAIPLIICLLNDKSKSVKGVLLIAAIIPSLIAAIIGTWKIIDFKSKMGQTGDNPFAQALSSSISVGFGLYLVVLSGIALPIVSFLIKYNSTELAQD
jgi:hypothetical protein